MTLLGSVLRHSNALVVKPIIAFLKFVSGQVHYPHTIIGLHQLYIFRIISRKIVTFLYNSQTVGVDIQDFMTVKMVSSTGMIARTIIVLYCTCSTKSPVMSLFNEG